MNARGADVWGDVFRGGDLTELSREEALAAADPRLLHDGLASDPDRVRLAQRLPLLHAG